MNGRLVDGADAVTAIPALESGATALEGTTGVVVVLGWGAGAAPVSKAPPTKTITASP